MPRTTIDIDANILDELKRVQKKEDASLGTAVNTLIAEALAARKEEQLEVSRLSWISRPMQACVALDDKEMVIAALETSGPVEVESPRKKRRRERVSPRRLGE